MQLEPYISFNDGQCESALNFYKTALNGEITTLMRFGEAPMPCDAAHKNRVMHSNFKAPGVAFMACDCMPEQAVQVGNNIQLSLAFTDEDKQTRVFEALAQGGKITMPLDHMFWGARFGMLVDQFGISWMFNCEKVS